MWQLPCQPEHVREIIANNERMGLNSSNGCFELLQDVREMEQRTEFQQWCTKPLPMVTASGFVSIACGSGRAPVPLLLRDVIWRFETLVGWRVRSRPGDYLISPGPNIAGARPLPQAVLTNPSRSFSHRLPDPRAALRAADRSKASVNGASGRMRCGPILSPEILRGKDKLRA